MNELQQTLSKITALQDVPEPYILKQLIAALRVGLTGRTEKSQRLANENIRTLIEMLKANPDYASGLSTFILTLLNTHHRMSIFTDTGISDYGFVHNLMRLIGHRFLPLLPDDDNIIELVDYLFDKNTDIEWLEIIEDDLWLELIALLDSGLLNRTETQETLIATAKNNLLNAMVVLSYRINGLGLHPDLMRAYPEILNFSAAFVAQNQEAVLFANQYRSKYGLAGYENEPALSLSTEVTTAPLLVMLEQCEDIVSTIRKRIYKTGISIRLTNMLLRLEQSIDRLRNLSELLSDEHHQRDKAVVELTQAVIVSAKRRYSIRHLISTNTELLSRKVTENAGRVGEHYISTDKAGYQKMFKKAAIGGFVIAFMATMKILSYDLELAPMGRAFVNSMIYGLGFVFIHIIHGTVATKQPAMTAAAIASTISEGSGKKSHQLAKLSELMVDILRTQFIAIMGNVMLAMPLAFLISYIWLQVNGAPMIGFEEAEHLLTDINPFTSLALLYAGIAGIFLFVAGLIAGFYDNLAVFNHVGERIGRHKGLRKIISKRRTERLGRFVEANLGAIMGNFMFGVFLGSTATVGYIFGLPLDIRHIAFSSANFAHGLFNLSVDDFSFSLVFVSLLGVALIGVMNLLVSFSLALIVALRSKGGSFSEWQTLAKLVFNHLMTNTRDFFWPRPEPMQYSHIDSHGQIIRQETNKQLTKAFSDGHAHTSIAIQRLSDIKVTPDGVSIDRDRISQAAARKTLNENIQDATATEVNPAAPKEVVLSDETATHAVDTALPEHKDANEAPELNRDKAADNAQVGVSSTVHSHDAVHSAQRLPKPKKPPNLPD